MKSNLSSQGRGALASFRRHLLTLLDWPELRADPAPTGGARNDRRFPCSWAINRERTGKILFFRPILPLFGSFSGKITKLFQSVAVVFPCYFDNREAPARNREEPHP